MEGKLFGMDKGDLIIGALIALMAWFRGEKAPLPILGSGDGKGGKQEVISILHSLVSKEDEGIWAMLISKMHGKQLLAINKLAKYFKRIGEMRSFRLAIVNMPAGETAIIEVPDPSDKTGVKKIRKKVRVERYSDLDARIVFLKDIADLVNDPSWGLKAVRDMLRTHKLVNENVVAIRALEIWKKSLSLMNEQVCYFFRVDSLDEITPEIIVKILDIRGQQAAKYVNAIARQVPYRRPADMNIGFWRGNYRRNPISTVGLAVCIIVVFVWSIYLANN